MKTIDAYFEYNDFMSIEITRFKTPNTKEAVRAIINKIVKNKGDDLEIEMKIKNGYEISIISIEGKVVVYYLGMEAEYWYYNKEEATLEDIVSLVNEAMKYIEEDK